MARLVDLWRFTNINGDWSATGRAQDRKVRRPKTDVLPLCHTTRLFKTGKGVQKCTIVTSRSTHWTDFHQIFTVWHVFDRRLPIDLTPLSDRSRDVAMATNFRVKMGEIGRLIFIPKRLGISPFWFKVFYCRRSDLVNFGPVTPEFKNGKRVQPLVRFFKTNLSDKLSQDPLDRFSPNLYHMVGIFDRRLPIWPSFFRSFKERCHNHQFCEIGRLIFIRPKRIGISKFRFHNFQCRWSGYSV